MTINPTGAVQLGGSTAGVSIAYDLSLPATGTISLNDSAVRGMIGAPSGQITMNDAHGKSGGTPYSLTVSSPAINYNIYSAAQAAGWPGTTPASVTVTVNPGVYITSNQTSFDAMTTGSPWPALSNIKIINNGYILGKGGAGGASPAAAGAPGSTVPGSYAPGYAYGEPGGIAISLYTPITLDNTNGVIAGGGGGGSYGGHVPGFPTLGYASGGGGAGGGEGGKAGYMPIAYTGPSAPVGTLGGDNGNAGADGTSGGGTSYGGGGGRSLGPFTDPLKGSAVTATGNPAASYVGGKGGYGGGSGGAVAFAGSAPGSASITSGYGGSNPLYNPGTGANIGIAGSAVGNPAGNFGSAGGGGGGWGAPGGVGGALASTTTPTTTTTLVSNYGSGGRGIYLGGKTVSYPGPTAQGTIYGSVS